MMIIKMAMADGLTDLNLSSQAGGREETVEHCPSGCLDGRCVCLEWSTIEEVFQVPQLSHLKWRDIKGTLGKRWDRNGEVSQQKQAKVS